MHRIESCDATGAYSKFGEKSSYATCFSPRKQQRAFLRNCLPIASSDLSLNGQVNGTGPIHFHVRRLKRALYSRSIAACQPGCLQASVKVQNILDPRAWISPSGKILEVEGQKRVPGAVQRLGCVQEQYGCYRDGVIAAYGPQRFALISHQVRKKHQVGELHCTP